MGYEEINAVFLGGECVYAASLTSANRGLRAMDPLTELARSRNMAKIRAKNTKPELIVRRAAHKAGLRFRLHRKDLPGTPDLVLPRHRLAIFVNGCFWHRHEGCPRSSLPASNVEFWVSKFERNVARDQAAMSALRAIGWRVAVIWECETKNPPALVAALLSIVGGRQTTVCSPTDLRGGG